MKPRRVAYVVNVFPKVSETFIANELAEVRRRGIEVRILSRREPEESVRHPVVTEAGLDRRTVYGEESFRGELRRFRPDLIHAHFATRATATARELSRELSIPYTFTAHRYDIYDRPPQDFAERAAAASGVVTVSRANAEYMARHFGIPRGRIRIIPCGIDLARFCSDHAERPAGPPWIVCVARLHPVKNLGVLLRACAELRARGVDFRCAVLGDGRERAALQAQIKGLGLGRMVTLRGACTQDTVRRWLRHARVAVLTSHSEGMPVSLMEAMACGVPTVAPTVGGIPEMIIDGVTGHLTRPDDACSTADALESALANPVLAEQMGRAARARAVGLFSLQAQVDSLLEVWEHAAQGRAAA